MYLRGVPLGEVLRLPPGSRVCFDTYFNSFSLKKWLEWTALTRLTLELNLKGDVVVELFGLDWQKGEVKKTVLAVEPVHAPERMDVLLPCPRNDHTLVAFSLSSHGDSIIYGGRYLAEVSPEFPRPVKIALVICTYKKEEDVKRNLRLLHDGVKELSIFVVDNGRTLGTPPETCGNLRIFHNRNTGGAGGFTRGLMEVTASDCACTHILLMDDDVSISLNSLERLKKFLSLLREDAASAVVGGAMLRRDNPSIQEENGAWIVADVKEGVRQIPGEPFANLSSREAVVKNETVKSAQKNGKRYQPWYFCCFPASAAGPENLPLPLFLRGDDVEYSLRNFNKFINMNGLCVWHDSFEKKTSNMLHYFINRNLCIIMVFSLGLPGKNVLRRVRINLRNQLYRYNYNAAEAILDGFSDFLGGPRRLAEMSPESVLERQSARNEAMIPRVESCSSPDEQKETVGVLRQFLFRGLFRLTVGGHWLPSIFFAPEGVLSTSAPYDPYRCFLKKSLRIVDFQEGKELRRNINRIRCLRIVVRWFLLRLCLAFRWRKLRQEWAEQGMRLMTREFWKQYLNL
ncbi:MAG: glycosyltransferase [Synergistaceae bacterium]|jgi:GT2 family glycosyltransferase|nr:glycosyltransferase [Synergistaceae bacterium]